MKLLPFIYATLSTTIILSCAGAAHAGTKTIYFKKSSGASTVRNIHVVQESDSAITNENRYYLSDYAKCRDFSDGVGEAQCKVIQDDTVLYYDSWNGHICDAPSSDVFMTVEANKVRDKLKKGSQRASFVADDSSEPVWIRYKQDGDERFACVKPSALENGATITLKGGYDAGRNAYN